jgi:hypothetical protein
MSALLLNLLGTRNLKPSLHWKILLYTTYEQYFMHIYFGMHNLPTCQIEYLHIL